MNTRGGVLPVALFLALACALLASLFAQIAAAELERQRAATTCDFSLLTAMRVRREGLEAIAARWDAFGSAVTATGATLSVDPAVWPSVQSAAEALRRAVSGYQGRVTASLTVALDANALPRTAARTVTGTGLRLGISAVTETVSIGPGTASLPGAWYARGWSPTAASPSLSDEATLTIQWPLAWRGGAATVPAVSSAVLEWDLDPAEPLAAAGRGGFSRTLSDGIAGTLFLPHRFPLFRAALSRAS